MMLARAPHNPHRLPAADWDYGALPDLEQGSTLCHEFIMAGLAVNQRYDAAFLEERGRGRAKAAPSRLAISPDRLLGERFLKVGCGYDEALRKPKDRRAILDRMP